MNEEIKEAIGILKQANIETTTGCCEKCPVKNKNKTCIGCLDDAKKLLLNYITNLQEENQKLNKIIDELERWLEEIQDSICGCGITSEYIYAYENVLDKLLELKNEVE